MTRRVKYSIGNTEFESISKCSEHFGVAPNTIKNWIERGINGLSYLSRIDGVQPNTKIEQEVIIQPISDMKVPTAIYFPAEKKTFNSYQHCSTYFGVDDETVIGWIENKTYGLTEVESKVKSEVKSEDELFSKVLRKLEEVKSVNNILMGMIDELVIIIKKI